MDQFCTAIGFSMRDFEALPVHVSPNTGKRQYHKAILMENGPRRPRCSMWTTRREKINLGISNPNRSKNLYNFQQHTTHNPKPSIRNLHPRSQRDLHPPGWRSHPMHLCYDPPRKSHQKRSPAEQSHLKSSLGEPCRAVRRGGPSRRRPSLETPNGWSLHDSP